MQFGKALVGAAGTAWTPHAPVVRTTLGGRPNPAAAGVYASQFESKVRAKATKSKTRACFFAVYRCLSS